MFFKINKFKKIVSFLILVFISNISGEGFISGTLIKSNNKHIPIDQLKENDSVTSYNFKNKNLFESKILKVKKQNYDKCIKFKIDNDEIICTYDHKFFCPLRKNKHGNWFQAKDLQKDDFILRNIKDLVRISGISVINCPQDFYCLSIENNHNFFVTRQDIFVHNVIWIPIFEFTIGAGFKWLLGWKSITSAFTGLMLTQFAKNNRDIDIGSSLINGHFERLDENKKNHIFMNDDGRRHGFIGGPNDEDPEKWWEKIVNRVKEAYAFDQLPKNGEWKISQRQDVNPNFGDLIIKGFINSGIIHIGTAFLEKK